MKVKEILWILLIAVTIFFLGRVTKRDKVITNTVTIKDTITWTVENTKLIYDTIYYADIKYDTIIKNDTIIEEINNDDLINVYLDYFATKVYNDTIKNDSVATVIIKEDIAMNAIQNRKVSFMSNLEYKVPIPANKGLSIGLLAGKDLAVPITSYELKNGISYSVGYNLPTKTPIFGIQFKLNKLFK